MAALIRKRGRTWEQAETIILVEKWGEENIQEKLKACTRKRPIWEEISVFVRAAGYEDRELESCKTRIHTLVHAYRLFKDECSRSGNGNPRKKPPFFEELDKILSCKPATKPAVVINSATFPATTQDVERAPALALPNQPDAVQDKPEALIHTEEEVDCSIVEGPLNEKPVVFSTKAKKRRMTMKDALGGIDKVLQDFVSYQKEADKRFLEEEEARERREEERERERRREDQEFFLRLAEVLKK